VRKTLGFVGDRRRFNVLISRARQRMIFVGSSEFLRTISAPLGLESDPTSDFLRKFLDTLEEMIKHGRAGRVIDRAVQGAQS
jgi:superfamily I DNA and/or RNA helicase